MPHFGLIYMIFHGNVEGALSTYSSNVFAHYYARMFCQKNVYTGHVLKILLALWG